MGTIGRHSINAQVDFFSNANFLVPLVPFKSSTLIQDWHFGDGRLHAFNILVKFLESPLHSVQYLVNQAASHDSILWSSTNQKKENGFLPPQPELISFQWKRSLAFSKFDKTLCVSCAKKEENSGSRKYVVSWCNFSIFFIRGN